MEAQTFVGPQEYHLTKLQLEDSANFSGFDLNKTLKPSVLGNCVFESVYKGYDDFCCLPANVFEAVYNSDENVLISVMNKSGKTTASEFAILRETKKESFLIVYISPVATLIRNRFEKWAAKLGGIGMRVVEVTDDVSEVDFDYHNLLLATPRKWDVLSRSLKEKDFQKISLVIIDDLHMLPSEPLYELLISRFKKYPIRLLGLCSLVLNPNVIGEWIGAAERTVFNFPAAARRVPLEVYLQGVDITYLDRDSVFEAFTKAAYRTIITNCENGKSAIVYAPSKHTVHLMVFYLIGFDVDRNRQRQGITSFVLQSWETLKQKILNVKDFRLRIALRCGVGFLHDELVESDKKLVRELFDEGFIQVCVLTASLCWVEPLLAHVVVVMGQLSDEFEWIQMLGHAMKDKVAKCFFLHNLRAPIDKHLELKAIEVKSNVPNYDHHDHINSLIAARQIREEEDLTSYIQGTFYYKSVLLNPEQSLLHVLSRFREHVEELMKDLVTSKCVEIDNNSICPLAPCTFTSYYYITYSTFQCLFPMLSHTTTVVDLLNMVTSGPEFSYLPVRVGESRLLQKLIRQRKYLFGKSKYSDPHGKAFVLLQAHLSRHSIGGLLLRDQHEVVSTTERLLTAIAQYVIHCERSFGLGVLVIEVMQMIKQATWGHDSSLLQLPNFTREMVSRCFNNLVQPITTVSELRNMEVDERRQLLQISDSQYMELESVMNEYPNIVVTFEVQAERVNREVILDITVERISMNNSGWWIFVGEKGKNLILSSKRVMLYRENTHIKLRFAAPDDFVARAKIYTLSIKSDTYIGCDREYNFVIDSM